MNVNAPLTSGLQGIQEGISGIEKSAAEIVRAGTVDGAEGANDVLEPIIELRLYQRAVEASSQVVRTADEVLGTILDTMA
jgi:flagellar basal body rod protein FlgG